MEETSKYGVLGRHQPCSEERIEVLTNTIERFHSSRSTLTDKLFNEIYNKTLPTTHLVKTQRR